MQNFLFVELTYSDTKVLGIMSFISFGVCQCNLFANIMQLLAEFSDCFDFFAVTNKKAIVWYAMAKCFSENQIFKDGTMSCGQATLLVPISLTDRRFFLL